MKKISQLGMFDAPKPEPTPEAPPAEAGKPEPVTANAVRCPRCGAEARASFRFRREGLYYCQFCPADEKSELGDSQFFYFRKLG